MMIYELNYKKLNKIIDLEALKELKYLKYTSKGFMDLHVDFLRREKDGSYVISMAHNYIQNGDVIPDPDMELKINPKFGVVEALTFQNSLTYSEAYIHKNGQILVNLPVKRSLNKFLATWLSNIRNQNYAREK